MLSRCSVPDAHTRSTRLSRSPMSLPGSLQSAAARKCGATRRGSPGPLAQIVVGRTLLCCGRNAPGQSWTLTRSSAFSRRSTRLLSARSSMPVASTRSTDTGAFQTRCAKSSQLQSRISLEERLWVSFPRFTSIPISLRQRASAAFGFWPRLAYARSFGNVTRGGRLPRSSTVTECRSIGLGRPPSRAQVRYRGGPYDHHQHAS
jgi:hypothetical protein